MSIPGNTPRAKNERWTPLPFARAEAFTTADLALLAEAAQWKPEIAFSELSVERLRAIAEENGADFATALVHDRALRVAANAEFSARMHHPVSPSGGPEIIGIVPGAFHGQHKHTGADGVILADTFAGMAPEIVTIPVRSFGTLEENAALVLDWLEKHRGRRIALASISKGGADVKTALASPRAAQAFATVQTWISVGGILLGTPLVGWLRARPLRHAAFGMLLRLQGHRTAAVRDLRWGPDGPLATWPALPSSLRIVHIHACPLRRHLRHPWAVRGYDRLVTLGANDGGGILLGDLSRLPGIVCPIWGADHYLQPSWDATTVLRAIAAAAFALPDDPPAITSAKQPITTPAIKSTA